MNQGLICHVKNIGLDPRNYIFIQANDSLIILVAECRRHQNEGRVTFHRLSQSSK